MAQAVADRGTVDAELRDLKKDDRVSLGLLVPLISAVIYVAGNGGLFALAPHLRAPVALFVAAVIVVLFILHANRAYAINKREAFLGLLSDRIGARDFRGGYTRWALTARSLARRIHQAGPGRAVSCAKWAKRQMKLGRRRRRERHEAWSASRAFHTIALAVALWLAVGGTDLAWSTTWPTDRRGVLIAVLALVLIATALIYLVYDLRARRGRQSRTFYTYAWLAVLAGRPEDRSADRRPGR